MTLAFARGFAPDTRLLLPAVLAGGCTAARRTPARRQWLRVADRLAAGLSPAAAALAEGERGAELVEELLAQRDFRELVEATRECLAEPPEVQHRRLVMLARQTLERAMAWDGDPRAALFVLEEDARGRNPAETLADGVQKARRRAIAAASPATPSPAPEPPAQPPPSHAGSYDPLQAMVHRGAARLRDMVRIEQAIRLAAEHAAATSPAAPTTTVAAAHAALALRRAEPLHRPPLPLRHGLWLDPATGEPTDCDPIPEGQSLRPAQPP
jgi:hypothetical protein